MDKPNKDSESFEYSEDSETDEEVTELENQMNMIYLKHKREKRLINIIRELKEDIFHDNEFFLMINEKKCAIIEHYQTKLYKYEKILKENNLLDK